MEKNSKRNRQRNAFALLELLIVIAIIAALSLAAFHFLDGGANTNIISNLNTATSTRGVSVQNSQQGNSILQNTRTVVGQFNNQETNQQNQVNSLSQ